jgi:hypothetical protein
MGVENMNVTGVGKCDNSTIRTQSLYYSWTETNGSKTYRYVVSNSIPNHCYQVGWARSEKNQSWEWGSMRWVKILTRLDPTFFVASNLTLVRNQTKRKLWNTHDPIILLPRLAQQNQIRTVLVNNMLSWWCRHRRPTTAEHLWDSADLW